MSVRCQKYFCSICESFPLSTKTFIEQKDVKHMFTNNPRMTYGIMMLVASHVIFNDSHEVIAIS